MLQFKIMRNIKSGFHLVEAPTALSVFLCLISRDNFISIRCTLPFIVLIHADGVQLEDLVDVATIGPVARCLKLEARHVALDLLCRPIIFPQLKTALDVLEGVAPITTDVALEGLAEDGIELHDVLLEADDISIESKHVVNTTVPKVLDVDVLVLGQFNQVADLMLLRHHTHFHVIEAHIECVDAHRLHMRL